MSTKRNLLLIGLPGCGKSTVGALAAQRLGWAFADMDTVIETMSGRTIAELFAEGEEHFRDIETEACRQLAGRKSTVIAAGGGVVKRAENIELLRPSCLIVFLDRRAQDIVRNVDTDSRPLLREGAQRVLELERERRPLYLAAAEQIVPEGCSPIQAAEMIFGWIG